jgi:hypothetical protein
MLGYPGEQAMNAAIFRDGWYHTSDLAARDEAGYLTSVAPMMYSRRRIIASARSSWRVFCSGTQRSRKPL